MLNEDSLKRMIYVDLIVDLMVNVLMLMAVD